MDKIEVHKAAMKRFETMINTADSNIAKELVANDAPFYTPASPTPLYGGEGYLSVVHWMRQSFPDVQWKLEEMVAEGNVVAVRWQMSGTHKGEFMGMPATGKHFSTSVMNFYYFNDEGKVINDIIHRWGFETRTVGNKKALVLREKWSCLSRPKVSILVSFLGNG